MSRVGEVGRCAVLLFQAWFASSSVLRTAAEPLPLEIAFDKLYRLDFSSAQRAITTHIERHPADPLGYSVRSAAYLFYELDRLSILESEFFGSDKRIAEKRKPQADPQVRQELMGAIAEARRLAEAILQKNANDKNALFALCIASGIQTDYLALVEKRQLGSLSYAKESHRWALKLLAIDSQFYDAYLTTGISEYLLGSMPFFIRWIIRFDQAEGSKPAAVRNLELVSQRGRYFKPFAKVLLAIIHLREKRPLEAERLLRELHLEFPENRLYKKELDKLVQRRKILRGDP
ncbi:MAG: hypothetical protein NZV14_01095 [Bryobacteraceae bacterium]|nr:hypothetical protein [Bryobacteraceae bacterium]MDW8376726.1 hypothetical protein [Bryobacterales bacterium]